MKKFPLFSILILIILIGIKESAQAQSPCSFAKKAGSTYEDWGSSTATDAFGNVYTLGNFYSSTIVFGTTTLHNQSTDGGAEIFLVKYDSCGNFKWAKQAGGDYDNRGKSVATDAAGNVYVAGYFDSDTLYFGASAVKLINGSSYAAFVVKYDANGNAIWAQEGNGNAGNKALSLTVDASSNIYVTGIFSSDTIIFGSTNLINAYSGNGGVFIAKFNNSGNIQWLKGGGGDYDAYGFGIGTDAAGNIYVGGTFGSDYIRFGTDSLPLNGYYDIFVVKYNSSGAEQWLRTAGSTDDDEALSLATDASGNSYLTGYIGYSSTVSFGSHSITNATQSLAMFIAKYDASGTAQWAQIGQGDDYTFNQGENIKLDAAGNPYVIGSYMSDSLNLGAITLYNNSLSAGGGDSSYDVFVASYKTNGNISWGRTAGGSRNDFGHGIAAGTHNALYITGEFQSPSITFAGIPLTSANANGDVFITNNIATDTLVPNICLVTVDSLSQYNVILWDKTPFINVADTFIVYRDTANNNYAPIGKVPYDSLSMFTDTVRHLYTANGDPNISSWRYKIAVKDTSGNISLMSPYHQTIYIQNNSGNFSWSDYKIEGQQIPVPALSNYICQRDNTSNGNWTTIITLSASSTAYSDPNYSTYQNTASWRTKTVWSISCTPTIINPKNPDVLATNFNLSRSNVYRTNGASVNSISLDNMISVYPNPSNGIFQITTNGLRLTNIEIVNLLGERIYSAQINSAKATIDLNKQPNGVYFIHIICKEGSAVKKVTIDK